MARGTRPKPELRSHASYFLCWVWLFTLGIPSSATSASLQRPAGEHTETRRPKISWRAHDPREIPKL